MDPGKGIRLSLRGNLNKINQRNVPKESGTFLLPEGVYEGPLSITKDKFADLQVLKRFCLVKAAKFVEELLHI